jgi:hypothetical protein
MLWHCCTAAVLQISCTTSCNTLFYLDTISVKTSKSQVNKSNCITTYLPTPWLQTYSLLSTPTSNNEHSTLYRPDCFLLICVWCLLKTSIEVSLSFTSTNNKAIAMYQLRHCIFTRLLFTTHIIHTTNNRPDCSACGAKGDVAMTSLGGVSPSVNERSNGWAGVTELYSCNACRAQARFPRINNPVALLETRRCVIAMLETHSDSKWLFTLPYWGWW